MKKLLISASLFFLGGIFFLAAMERFVAPGGQSSEGLKVVFGIGLIAFMLGVAGFLFLISWRDDQRSGSRNIPKPLPHSSPPAQAAAPGVYGLREGVTYRVLQPFEDCYKNKFDAGELLTFKSRNFIPYHGGHTLIFAQRCIYLQEEMSAEILNRFETYLAPGEPGTGEAGGS